MFLGLSKNLPSLLLAPVCSQIHQFLSAVRKPCSVNRNSSQRNNRHQDISHIQIFFILIHETKW